MSGPRENGDWGLCPEEATLPGLGTLEMLEMGDMGEELMLMKGGGRPFWPNDTLCGIAGSGT